MSLINDALKRAKQAQQQQQNPFGGQPTEPLQPVDYSGRTHRVVRALVALLAVAALACSGLFFWKWWSSPKESRPGPAANQIQASLAAQANTQPQPAPRKSVIHVSTNIVVRPIVSATPGPDVEPRAEPTNAPPTDASVTASLTNAPSPRPQTNGPAALAAAEPAPPPSPFADLKLRSIIYRDDKPAAVINGDMVQVGDAILGARVVRIERQSVTVERKGETNELRLPRL